MLKPILLAALVFFSLAGYAGNPANLNSLLVAAKQGDPLAELNYAKAIYSTSKREAFAWAQKAAHQGLAEAWYWLGENSTEEQAVGYYAQAAKLGHVDAYAKVIDASLFAGNQADFARAKQFADMARQKKISVGMDQADSNEKLNTIDRCFAAGNPVIPVSDQPSINDKLRYQKQSDDCLNYRYGLNIVADLRKYRLCLLSQKETNNVYLAELYANGWGVKRDLNLAIALICYADDLAPAELTGMVNALYQNKQQKQAQPFLFCENITSGHNMSICAEQEAKIDAAKRSQKLQEITANWSEKDKIALQKLLTVANQFFITHSENELDMSGTAHGAIAIGEQMALNNQLLSALQNFEAGKLPTNSNIKPSDALLNQTYQQVMKLNYNNFNMGTITKTGIKATENLWLTYREAWVKFGLQRYPQTSADAWRVWATLNRIQQLKTILASG